MPSADTVYTLKGRAINAGTAEPVPKLTVQAFDFDRNRDDDVLGQPVQTDAEGRFEIEFKGREAGGPSEGWPEPYIIIQSGDLLAAQTSWLRLEKTEHDFGDIRVTVAQTEGELAIGQEGDPPSPKDPSAPASDMPMHGQKTRDVVAPRSPFYRGPFGRMFRELLPWEPPGASEAAKLEVLKALAATMIDAGDQSDDNEAIPAGYTYFGQFVDHDITFDPGSSLQKQNDPERLNNFRTPRFDLDNLYGGGLDDAPFLFDRSGSRSGKFFTGKGCVQRSTDEAIDLFTMRRTEEDDLPRNQQGVALIGDPRNDENLIVSQLQLAFLKFHNRALDWVSRSLTGREAFTEAQNLVRWHYQWVVLFDYLPRLIGDELVNKLLVKPNGDSSDADDQRYKFGLKFYGWKDQPYMPVEFSVAAYRFGHSQIRPTYTLNDRVGSVPIFRPPSGMPDPLADLRGGRPLPASWSMDWRLFFELGERQPQLTRLIDTKLSQALTKIPAGQGGENALATLNLRRGWRMGLPSGQSVAKAMGLEPLTNERLNIGAEIGSEAPLWYYILKEAELEPISGRQLGPVGARIVGEVFVGLAKGDPNSFINVDPMWTPKSAGMIEMEGDKFELRDILRFAGVGEDPFK